ncbi:MAG: hypothetical protein K6C94_08415 [Candidatus Gastranaerophilales bacterium]|nr:hypothetical protein [Candidatus Gastranaerophilales bacterium]
MVKKIFVLVLLFSVNTSVYALDYLNGTYGSADMQNLSRAEYAVFGQNNRSLSPQTRLMLAEERLFGTTQPGTFSDRVNFINRVAENRNRTYANINNLKKRNRVNYLFNEFFNGTMTGYTPKVYYPVQAGRCNSFVYHNTTIPQPYGNGIENLITQTRIMFEN